MVDTVALKISDIGGSVQLRMFAGKMLRDEVELAVICMALGATEVGGPLSTAEARLIDSTRTQPTPHHLMVEGIRRAISIGEDPLGDEFCTIRAPEERRAVGAFYTPPAIVRAMLAWALARRPARLVDAGCGSGRFAVEARRLGFRGELTAIYSDPLATLMTRAHLAAAQVKDVRVIQHDFLHVELEPSSGRTAFVGNPPYVRHHELSQSDKQWAKAAGAKLGVQVSGLAGLHALFILAAANLSKGTDVGCFITAAEWLDVGYGSALRELFAGRLGLVRIDLLNPRAATFNDAMTTAAIASWQVGYSGPITVRGVTDPANLDSLAGGLMVRRSQLAMAKRWSDLTAKVPVRNGLVPLGTYARAHRGVATGANEFFVLTRAEAQERGLIPYVKPCLIRAAQVISSPGVVQASDTDHVLLDLNAEVSVNSPLRDYLDEGEQKGVPDRYLCAHRKPWWRVGGAPPPPVVATYMARQPPVFAVNPDGCQIVNVFHGLHFQDDVGEEQMFALVQWLNEHREELTGGRTYHGGLRKFEPRELEAILVPPLERLKWVSR